MKEETKSLGQDMIDNYNDWKQADYKFYNDKIAIWTANGILFIDSYPNTNMFNIFEKRYIHKCIKKSKIKKALNKEI